MIFEDAEDYCKFLKLLKITKEKSEFKLYGYCLLGNHAYLLIREMDGRLFVQFIALILISATRKKMRGSALSAKYTVRELLAEMETLSKITYSGKYGHMYTEVTKNQRGILGKMGIEMPT